MKRSLIARVLLLCILLVPALVCSVACVNIGDDVPSDSDDTVEKTKTDISEQTETETEEQSRSDSYGAEDDSSFETESETETETETEQQSMPPFYLCLYTGNLTEGVEKEYENLDDAIKACKKKRIWATAFATAMGRLYMLLIPSFNVTCSVKQNG